MNAPSVFQRLMHNVLLAHNPDSGPDFVSVYIYTVILFSKTLTDHLKHLEAVLCRLADVALKLKPNKCQFNCQEVAWTCHSTRGAEDE